MHKFLLFSCFGQLVFLGFRIVAEHVNLEFFVQHGIFTTFASVSVTGATIHALGCVLFHRIGHFLNAVRDLNIRHIVVDQGLQSKIIDPAVIAIRFHDIAT